MWLSIGPKLPPLLATCRGVMASGDALHDTRVTLLQAMPRVTAASDAFVGNTPVDDVHRLLPQVTLPPPRLPRPRPR